MLQIDGDVTGTLNIRGLNYTSARTHCALVLFTTAPLTCCVEWDGVSVRCMVYGVWFRGRVQSSSIQRTSVCSYHQRSPADLRVARPHLPVLCFHAVIPVVCQSLHFDPRRCAVAVAFGSAVPLVLVLLWNGAAVVLAPPAGCNILSQVEAGAA